ncbi:glycosyltransferase [Thermaerobacter subterraneus]|uniref:Glycosyltransferase n=1 Tax=Thermaerobacter subterraneus DSM 13965 TaxID=867903 RepID=K6PM03_9FIRM|nr:glycosyltransferase [Thermaerobacter subterraneus]EKP93902.1 glycosyltransferase [Thermaerobacter subterraneus DSM 13965]
MHRHPCPDEPSSPSGGTIWWLAGPAAGGVGTYVEAVGRQLVAAGASCRLITVPAGGSSAWGALRALGAQLRHQAGSPRLIHAHGLKAALAASLACPRVPLVMTLHTFPTGWWQRQVARWVARRCRAVVAVSRALATWAAVAGIVPAAAPGRPAQVHVLVPPLQRVGTALLPRQRARRELALPDVGPVVGTIARLSREKGVDVLLRAVALVHRHGLPVTCLVIGAGPDEPALRRLAGRLGIGAWVRWAGHRQEAARWLRAVDVYVQPSRQEAYGLAAAEAMAAACPVVVSRTGGLEDLVRDGIDGRLVPPGDPVVLARVLFGLLRDEAARHRLARAAAARASRWPDAAQVARQHLQLYGQLATPPAAARRTGRLHPAEERR